MSQQHTTQASGQGVLERVFRLREHNMTAQTEVITGFTTFLTVVYIVFVNPQILGVAGMDTGAVFVMTCLIVASGNTMTGLFASLSVALAPTVGLNTLFTFVIVQAMGLLQQVGMGAIFWGMIGLLLLTIFHVRHWVIANTPVNLRVDITSGIGLSISMTGPRDTGVVVTNPETLVSIGGLTSRSVLLGILDPSIIVILASCNIHAAVLVSIMVTTLLGWMLGNVHYNDIVSVPPSVVTVVGHVDLVGSFNLGLAGVVFSFMLVSLFDSSNTLTGVTDKARLVDEKGKFPRMKQALYVDSISSVAGSFTGISSVTAYIESSPDASVGGRTGLTTAVVGLLLLLVIFLSPLAGMVSDYVTASALIYVGVLMTSSLARMDWQNLTEPAPAFITAMMMSFSFSTTEGIVLGSIPYYMTKIGTGRLCDLSPRVIIVALLFILKIVSIDAH